MDLNQLLHALQHHKPKVLLTLKSLVATMKKLGGKGHGSTGLKKNLRLLSSWLNNSVDPIDSNDKKSEYYWRAVAAEYNNNTRRNDRKRTVMKCKTHWGGVDDGKRVRRDRDENRVAGGKRVRRTRERNWGSRTCGKESRGSHGILLLVIFFLAGPTLFRSDAQKQCGGCDGLIPPDPCAHGIAELSNKHCACPKGAYVCDSMSRS